jgi:hypothetical protein
MSHDAIKPQYWFLIFIALAALATLGVHAGTPKDYPHNPSHFYDKTYKPQGTLE